MVLSHTPKGTSEAPKGTAPFGIYLARTLYILYQFIFCSLHDLYRCIIQVEDSDELEVWPDNEVNSQDEEAVPVPIIEEMSPCARIVQLYVMFLITWQAMFRLSDAGLNVLLTFIATFFALLVKVFALDALKPLLDRLPRTVQAARNFLGYDRDKFIKYVICPSCHSIYTP